MHAVVFQSRPSRPHISACALFALAVGGFGLTAPVRGAISADILVHVPQRPTLLISASAWNVETETWAREGLSPLYLSAESPLPTHGGLFESGMRATVWTNAVLTPALTVMNGAPGERERIVTAARDPLVAHKEYASASLRHMWKDSAGPLALEHGAEFGSSAKPLPGRAPVTVRSSGMPGFAKESVTIRPMAILDGSAQAMREMPPEARVTLRVAPDGYAETLDQRLVAGVLDEAEHGGHTKLDDALKRELRSVLAHGAPTESSYRAFSLLLADSTGTNDLERGQALLAWTEREGTEHDLSRMIYFTALHHYRSLQYDAALKHINRYLAAQGAEGAWEGKDQLLMLKALCAWGEGNDGAFAIEVVTEMLEEHPDSPLVPHALFLRAWVNLYCGRTAEARTGFGEVIARHPQSEFAGRARQVLAGMDADD